MESVEGSETMAKVKYEYWKSYDGLLLIEGWARDGLTDEQIAHNMGINPDTLYSWKKKFPEISEALKKTKEVVDREVENALYKKALSGDTTALIFWLKNRRPNDWRDRRETQLSGSVQTVPDRLVIDYGDNAED
jgi:transposase-like protein